MVLRRLLAAFAVLGVIQLASAQNITGLTTIPPPTEGGTGYVIGPSGTTPFYSAPSTFTPTASGPSPGAGTEVTITNASPTGLFSFTRPFSSVPPTGTITDSSAQAEATSLDSLQPTPDGLESAPAGRLTAPIVFANPAALLVSGAIAWVAGGLMLAQIR